jgi:hypothetical protein
MRALLCGWAVVAAMALSPNTASAQLFDLFGSDDDGLQQVGAPIGRPVGMPIGSANGLFGSPATPVFQPVDFSNVVAPVPEIPTAANESFFDSFYRRLASLVPFQSQPTSGERNGWFPSLRRRNVERHQMWEQ